GQVFAAACVWGGARAEDMSSNVGEGEGGPSWGGEICNRGKAVALPHGNYYPPGTAEVFPADVAAPSPDDRFHHCIYHHVYIGSDPWGYPLWDTTPKTRCFFAPMNSS